MALLVFHSSHYIYKEDGVGIKSYRIEQFAMWTAWLAATMVLGGSLMYYPFFALVMWFACAVIGGRVIRYGLRLG